ncbi:MAG: transglutaminase domain-containing protein [Phycisphaerae bacterium]|nr:transglutaminase domain-containing protein [Phycisphaerae bacterium]
MHALHTRKLGIVAAAMMIGLLSLSRGSLLLAADDEFTQPAPKNEPIKPPPEWVKVEVPEQYKGFVGSPGLPEAYQKSWKTPVGLGTQYIDFWQADHNLIYRPETAKFLYSDYSSTETPKYVKGTLPTFERLVDEHCYGMVNNRDKAIVLLREVLPKLLIHPGMPPLGPPIPGDRGLTDEGLLESKKAFCNEQARVFVRLCQVAGIPARMIFLFYADKTSGHVIAEFYADGQWSMADCTYFTVFPAADGHLMSAAECHGKGKLEAGKAYYRRYQQIIRMSDDEIAGAKYASIADKARRDKRIRSEAEGIRERRGAETPESIAETFGVFGVLNYPLPPAPANK